MAKEPKNKSKWIPLVRDYVLENRNISVKLKPVKMHPLLKQLDDKKEEKKQIVKKKKKKKGKVDIDDPLRLMSFDNTDDDPLLSQGGSTSSSSVTSHASRKTQMARRKAGISTGIRSFEAWVDKTSRILSKYSTNKRIAVTATFMEEDPEQKGPKAVDQVANRLEELEADPESNEAKSMMSQKEYIAHIEDQHERLKAAWDAEERVVSLKIAIQCAKLLGDTSVPQFYPSMYVLLTSILDTFGELVFDRIKNRGIEMSATSAPRSLPSNFRAGDVSRNAKETCRNWFYKTACIRELIPRLYIDLSLIKSYRFLEDDTFPTILQRLSRAFRGIGDPLAATYARAYLTHKVNYITNCYYEDSNQRIYRSPPDNHKKSILEAFDDLMFTFKYHREEKWLKAHPAIDLEKISKDDYLDLYAPAIEWLLQNIGYGASEELFFAFIQQYRDYCNNSMILIHILGSFKPSFVSNHAQSMVALIQKAEDHKHTPKSKLYLVLGKCLIKCAPPKSQRLAILNDVWKVVTKIQDVTEYMEIAVVFVQYLLMNFSEREVNIFLKDVIKHAKKEQSYLKLQDQLQLIVNKIMELSQNLEKTLSMDNFLPVIDLLEKYAKVECGKHILRAFAKSSIVSTSDPVIIHTLSDVARSLNDSINSMTFDDDRRQISVLLVAFIRKIDFGRDLEKQLNTYVDCRQSFTSLDIVLQELVLRVTLLATRAHSFMKGKHTRKTSAFVKACMAYCHITIPSLDDHFSRLRLLLQCGEVALLNQMIIQAEGFLKLAVTLIRDVPPTITNPISKKVTSSESELVAFLRNFAAFLLLFPGHPTKGPFYLIKGLLNATNSYEPWKSDSASQGKTQVYLGVLSLFCAYYQPNFPYRIERVQANDELYGGNPTYKKDLGSFIETLVSQILQQLTEIGKKGDLLSRKHQGTLAIEFVNIIISSFEMTPQSATLAVKLYQLAAKNKAVESSYLKNTMLHLKYKKGTMYQDVYNKIVELE